MNEEPLRQPTALFKALMHPARVAILELLRREEACVCHIEAALNYRQAYISQQLAMLREAGLVQDRRDGWNVYYRVIEPEVYTLLAVARQITGAPEAIALPSVPLATCPCPTCSPTGELVSC